MGDLASPGGLRLRRREFLTALGATVAASGFPSLTGCGDAGDARFLDAGELATLLGTAAGEVDQAIQWLLREKRLIRTGGLLFHSEALGALKGAVRSERALKPAESRVTLDVATFKTRFNLTRKHAIPLLEWLDRERVTRRTGDVRIVL